MQSAFKKGKKDQWLIVKKEKEIYLYLRMLFSLPFKILKSFYRLLK